MRNYFKRINLKKYMNKKIEIYGPISRTVNSWISFNSTNKNYGREYISEENLEDLKMALALMVQKLLNKATKIVIKAKK
jgi:hypothetical protein